jgi:hypothetical protein
MADKQIFIKLVVDDNGSVIMNQFGKNAENALDKVEKKSSGFVEKIKSNWLGITAASAAVVGSFMAIEKALDFAEMGAKAKQAEESFRLMARSAGESADDIIEAMKKASVGTIDESDLMRKAGKAMSQDLRGDDIINITKAARIAARLSGEDVKTAYESITDSIANQMPKALRKYGLATKDQISLVNQLMAAGVQDVDMMAIATANMLDKQARLGSLVENDTERLQRYRAELHNAWEELSKNWVTTLHDIVEYSKELQGLSGDSTLLKYLEFLVQIKNPGEFATRVQTEGWAKAIKKPAPAKEPEIDNEYLVWMGMDADSAAKGVQAKMKAQLQDIQNAKLRSELLKDIDASRIKVMESNAAREVEITKMKTGDDLYAEQIAIDRKKEINDAYYKYRLGEIAAEANANEKKDKYFDRDYFEKGQKGKLDADMKARKAETENAQILHDEKEYQQQITFEQNSMVMAVENENKARKETIDRLVEIASIDQKRRDSEIDHTSKMAVLGARYGENGPGDLVRLDYLAQENKLLSERLRITDELKQIEGENLKPGMEGYEDWTKQKTDRIASVNQIDQDVAYLKTQSEKAMIEFGNDGAGGFATGLKVFSRQIGSEFQIWEQMAKDSAQGMQSAVSDYFFDAITGKFQSFEDFMSNIGKVWGRSLADAMAKEMMSGDMLTGGLKMLGGGLDSLGGMAFDMLKILGFAEGGRPPVDKPSLVGEKGPEIFIPDRAGTIVPNAALSGSFGGEMNFNSSVIVGVPGLSKKQLSQLHRELEEAQVRVVERRVKDWL